MDRHAVCGLDLVGKDRQELQAEQLPKAMVHMLLLAKHIQQQLVDIYNQQVWPCLLLTCLKLYIISRITELIILIRNN